MTFLTDLSRLSDAATQGPFIVRKNGDGAPYLEGAGLVDRSRIAQHCDDPEGWADAELHALLRSRCGEILALVKAVKAVHETAGCSISDLTELSNALYALDKPQEGKDC